MNTSPVTALLCNYSSMAFTIPDLQDPKSQSYKKARQQYYKATKNRPTNCELDWSPFRAAEKRYKARFPLPDLSSVLDLALLDNARHQEVERGVWKGSLNAVHYAQLPFKTTTSTPAYFIPSLPGAVDSSHHSCPPTLCCQVW